MVYEVLRAEITKLVEEAMRKQDTATYHGRSSETEGVAESTADKILVMIAENEAYSV